MKKKTGLVFLLICILGSISDTSMLAQGATQNAEMDDINKVFLQQQSPERYRKHLVELTKEPHITATQSNERVRDYMADVMRKAGWEVDIYPYDIYLPVMPGIAYAEIVKPKRLPLNIKEYIHEEDPFSSHPDLTIGFNAYTGSGDVTAEVIYANYGRKEDFELLASMGISVNGKIVIARYGGNFRGFKAKYAELYGAIGLIIYTDPEDSGYMKGPVYPEGPYFDESTIQRGSVLTLEWTGDPLTPFVPALPLDSPEKVVRLSPSDVKEMHTIPIMPLPYGSAKEIIGQMTGRPVPSAWQGGLPYAYRIEGGKDLQVRVHVQQEMALQRIYNVVGTLRGAQYPDEWIIAGCHYDAWNFGSIDPNSGTAMLLSLSESLGKMAEQGMRPKRTIKIAHWDAEEVGIIGSTEWVEQFKDELHQKAVAYMNADGAVGGRRFGGATSPSLKELLVNATRQVNYPDSVHTVYKHWVGDKKEAPIGNLGGGSDHLPFYSHIGIPSWNAGTGGTSLYHSNYDNHHYYEKFVDSSFKMGPMVEQVFGIATLQLASQDVLPYSLTRYGKDTKGHFEALQKQLPQDLSFSFIKLIAAAASLESIAASCEIALKTANKSNIRKINQDLIMLEREWIEIEGMPYGSWYRSMYASSDPYSGYASWMMPAFQYELSISRYDELPKWETKYLNAIRRIESRLKNVIKLAK